MLATIRFFRRLILSKKSYCCKHRFCIPYGTQNLLVRENSLRPLKQKNAEFGACDFRFAPHKKTEIFCTKKATQNLLALLGLCM